MEVSKINCGLGNLRKNILLIIYCNNIWGILSNKCWLRRNNYQACTFQWLLHPLGHFLLLIFYCKMTNFYNFFFLRTELSLLLTFSQQSRKLSVLISIYLVIWSSWLQIRVKPTHTPILAIIGEKSYFY